MRRCTVSRAMSLIHAVSPNRVWSFADGRLRSATEEVEPLTPDFFERWTFARFLDNSTLALGFETGQPWSEYGSYGERLGGVQVLVYTGTPAAWCLMALEYDWRRHDESFVPDDITWHPRGVLAVVRHGELRVQVLAAPRGEISPDILPPRDSDQPLVLSFDLAGTYRAVTLDEHGRMLTARDDDGQDIIDLELRQRRRDDGAWEPL